MSTESQQDYAVVASGGKQYRVIPGNTIVVEKLESEPGSTVTLTDVLLVRSGGSTKIGTPQVEGSTVSAKVVSHGRGPKKIIFKKKRRKGYRLKQGHRQDFTKLLIESIS